MPRLRLRGLRTIESSQKRNLKWRERGGRQKIETALASNTTTEPIEPEEYPGHFANAPINANKVTKKLKKLYPGIVPRNLPSVIETGRFFIPTPQNVLAENDLHPPYLVARFDRIVKKSVAKALLRAWDELSQLDVQFPKPEKSRSATPALHLGIWQLYNTNPYITGDSRHQSEKVIVAMDKFLRIIQEHIAPKLRKLLKQYYPQQYNRQMRAYDRVKTILANELADRPAVDFGGAFFTVAVKEGSSERTHLDFNDDHNNVSWVIPMGEWEGGEFCAPQLKRKISVCSGQALAAMTRNLAHCSAPVNGRRVILTLFSDKVLLSSKLSST